MGYAPRQVPVLDEEIKDRFFSHIVKRQDGIWEWTGFKSGYGYGMISIKRKMFFSHRVSWAIREREQGRDGIIPHGYWVLHRNDVTPELCDVNPDNLWLGTLGDNNRDTNAKGRANRPTGKLTDAQKKNFRRGEDFGKLTNAQVLEIRAMKPFCSYRTICTKFNIAMGTATAIVYRKTWTHI